LNDPPTAIGGIHSIPNKQIIPYPYRGPFRHRHPEHSPADRHHFCGRRHRPASRHWLRAHGHGHRLVAQPVPQLVQLVSLVDQTSAAVRVYSIGHLNDRLHPAVAAPFEPVVDAQRLDHGHDQSQAPEH